jgi:hypothetical protein
MFLDRWSWALIEGDVREMIGRGRPAFTLQLPETA